MKRARRVGVALVLLVLLAGCKEGDVLPARFEPVEAGFLAEAPDATVTADYVTLEPAAKSGGRVTVNLVIHTLGEPLSGLALQLTYPVTLARFEGCSAGPLFPGTGCEAREPDPRGRVFVGVSLPAEVPAVSVPGDAVALSLDFLVFEEGIGDVVFEGQNLGGGESSVLLDEDSAPIFVRWFAGSLIGQ